MLIDTLINISIPLIAVGLGCFICAHDSCPPCDDDPEDEMERAIAADILRAPSPPPPYIMSKKIRPPPVAPIEYPPNIYHPIPHRKIDVDKFDRMV